MNERESGKSQGGLGASTGWDTRSHEAFYRYYAQESQSSATKRNFTSIRDAVLRVLECPAEISRRYDVVDVGCGAGTQSLVWAEAGHRVHAVDVNAPLLELGEKRAKDRGYSIEFRVGSANSLPWPDESMDICLAAELIEHVVDWRGALKEFARVLRPRGILFLATNNVVWPVQKEFNLPLYSWYPAPLKHHFERLATSTSPRLANFATYPAVNWFTYQGLRRSLQKIGFDCMNRFQIMNLAEKRKGERMLISLIRGVPMLNWLAVLCAPNIILLAVKKVA